MASRPAKEVLGISAIRVSLFAVEGAASDSPAGLSRTSELPWPLLMLDPSVQDHTQLLHSPV